MALYKIQNEFSEFEETGIGSEIELFIRRLAQGCAHEYLLDERTHQAKIMWKLGFGREIGFNWFEEYLNTIPEVPENRNARLCQQLVLVDRRLGITRTAKLLDIDLPSQVESDVVDYYDLKYPDVEFIWCQDGSSDQFCDGGGSFSIGEGVWRKGARSDASPSSRIGGIHAYKRMQTRREAFVEGMEYGLTLIEGMCLYGSMGLPKYKAGTHYAFSHDIILPGSVSSVNHDSSPRLKRRSNEKTRIVFDTTAGPHDGLATRQA